LFAAFGLTVLLLGFLVVACCIAFRGAAVAFGISIAIAVAGATALVAFWGRGPRTDAAVALVVSALAAWTIVATAWTFPPGSARWIAFGSGVGYILAGLVALVVHEVRTVRVVHVLEVRELTR
jgi:hypothetical protein